MVISVPLDKKREARDGRKLLCEQLYSNLSRAMSIAEADLRQMQNFEQHLTSAPAGRQLQDENGAGKPKMLVSGWVCQQRILEDGRRQIFSFFIPGDLLNCGQQSAAQPHLVALTGVVLLDASILEEKARLPSAPLGLANYFMRMEQRRISFLYNHILRLGSETAYERLRSLLKELFQRLSQAGFCHNQSVQLPLTQEVLADALGASAVHINRVLQQMRRDGVVKLQDGLLLIGSCKPSEPVRQNWGFR